MPDAEEYGPDMKEWVAMAYDGVEGAATATKEAFNEVWAPKGWTLVADLGHSREAPSYTEAQAVVDTGEAASLTKAELQDLAREQGLDDSGTKAELLERLEANSGGAV